MTTLYTLGQWTALPGREPDLVAAWQDDDAVAAWREHEGFRTRVDKLRQLVESFTPHSMDVLAQVGPATPDP